MAANNSKARCLSLKCSRLGIATCKFSVLHIAIVKGTGPRKNLQKLRDFILAL